MWVHGHLGRGVVVGLSGREEGVAESAATVRPDVFEDRRQPGAGGVFGLVGIWERVSTDLYRIWNSVFIVQYRNRLISPATVSVRWNGGDRCESEPILSGCGHVPHHRGVLGT